MQVMIRSYSYGGFFLLFPVPNKLKHEEVLTHYDGSEMESRSFPHLWANHNFTLKLWREHTTHTTHIRKDWTQPRKVTDSSSRAEVKRQTVLFERVDLRILAAICAENGQTVAVGPPLHMAAHKQDFHGFFKRDDLQEDRQLLEDKDILHLIYN